MNSTDIVGWVLNGAIYCVRHKPESPDEEPEPVFADEPTESSVWTCDRCHERLLEVGP